MNYLLGNVFNVIPGGEVPKLLSWSNLSAVVSLCLSMDSGYSFKLLKFLVERILKETN